MNVHVRFCCVVLTIAMAAVWASAAVPALPGAESEKTVLPEGATAGWWDQVQRDLREEAYRLTWRPEESSSEGSGAWMAENPAQGFETRFAGNGFRLTPLGTGEGGPDWSWGLELRSWGRPDGLSEVPAPALRADGGRMEYDRGDFTEWFVNGPEGLEHGFSVPTPPGGDRGCLVFDLEVAGGLRPVFSDDGRAVDFHDGGGIAVLRYASLMVTDAVGTVLPSRFEPVTGGIRIRIEDASALYPLTVDPLATTPSWTASGEAMYGGFGYSVATAGDVNGDGYSDVVVGAPSADDDGKAYLFLGSASGLAATASWTASGEAADDFFGFSVATAGDVNGDGYSDVVVGAPSADDDGKAYLFLGSASGLAATASWTAEGEATEYYFGCSVATAGDVNGDGYADVVVGAEGNEGYFGKAYLYLGSASGPVATASWTAAGEDWGDYFGCSVAMAGDVNGDGYSDVVVGARRNDEAFSGAGKAYLYLGGASGLSATPSWTAVGEAAGDEFGCSVATAGDVSGDGYADVVVGAYDHDEAYNSAGKAYLYLGSASGLSAAASWTAAGEAADDYFGYSVATAGDVNGDGYADVVVGARGSTSEAGKATLYLGSASGLEATASWTAAGEAADNFFGSSAATAGDVNGDGYADVVVGAYGNTSGTGKAYVYLGGTSDLSAAAPWTASGENNSDHFGTWVAAAGDVNGDGYTDVVVGAYGNTSYTGKIYLFPGSASGLEATASWTAAGEAAGDRFGYSAATAGDVNGDGYADVVTGAFNHTGATGKAYLFLGSASGLEATASWTAAGEAAGDYFGYAAATAGDVNGDGYADVVVGALGNTGYTGKAYLYLGGPSGLADTASWTASGEAASDEFGYSVATAGDVNGDGYADVVVGAYGNTSYTGKAYLYAGSASGLSATASWAAAGEATNDYFGDPVATAGDVNGDGYSDVVVGAYGNTSNTGKTLLFLGSASGLEATASWTAAGEAAGDYFGYSAATAGDVNGDGYSDVVVGARRYTSSTGKSYLYLGGASGLSATASWTASGEATYDYFGTSVAPARDVNGDGYADLVVGADGNASNTGKAYLYYGNDEAGGGVPLEPRQLRADLSAPIAPLGRAGDGLFGIACTGRTPFGRGEVKLEWQVSDLGWTFSPTLNPPQTGHLWSDSGTAGTTLNKTLLVDEGDGPYIWRMRTKYSPATTPFQPHGPWLTPAANGLYETDLRRLPACVEPDEPVWIYEVTLSDPEEYPILHFQDPNQEDQRTGYHIRRSDDPELPKDTWPLVATNVVDMDEGTANIQWTDTSGDVPGSGTWYYQVTAYNSNCPAEGPF